MKLWNNKIIMLIFIFFIVLNLSFFLVDWNLMNNKASNKLEIECGMFSFINKNSNSILYLLFLVVFLIFDLEIILILILVVNLMNSMVLIFFSFMMLSLMMELFECSIKWND